MAEFQNVLHVNVSKRGTITHKAAHDLIKTHQTSHLLQAHTNMASDSRGSRIAQTFRRIWAKHELTE